MSNIIKIVVLVIIALILYTKVKAKSLFAVAKLPETRKGNSSKADKVSKLPEKKIGTAKLIPAKVKKSKTFMEMNAEHVAAEEKKALDFITMRDRMYKPKPRLSTNTFHSAKGAKKKLGCYE